MNTLFTPTSTTPVLGDRDIGYTELVADEVAASHEHSRIPNPNPSRCFPYGPACFDPARRHRVIASADQDAVENRSLVANDSAQGYLNNEVGHVYVARSGLSDDDDGGVR